MSEWKTEPFEGLELPHHEGDRYRGRLSRPAAVINRRFAVKALIAGAGAVLFTAARRTLADDCTQPSRTPIQGPYYLDDPDEKYDTGDGIVITGRVLGIDCKPIPGATIVRWHANQVGVYEEYYRASMAVKSDGSFELSTIKPGKYSNLSRHIHWYVTAPGHAPITAQVQWTDAEEIPSSMQFDFSLTKG
ncbi:MAG: hypothetical protein ACMG6S_08530 [Byssovorax sp.]